MTFRPIVVGIENPTLRDFNLSWLLPCFNINPGVEVEESLPNPYRIPSGVFFPDFCPEVPLDCPPATIFSVFPNARPVVNPGIALSADKFHRSPS